MPRRENILNTNSNSGNQILGQVVVVPLLNRDLEGEGVLGNTIPMAEEEIVGKEDPKEIALEMDAGTEEAGM